MPELLRVGVMASGRGSDLQSIIDACQSGKVRAEVVVVISDRADAFALERARRYGLAAVHLPVGRTGSADWEEADRRQVELFSRHGVQLVCLAGYMRIIGPALLAAYPRAIMNIHPALLPAFPGVGVQAQAAAHGVKIAGCTVHFADPQFDAGPIIIQAAVPVLDGDTGEELGARILEQEHRLYPQAIKWFAEGRLQVEGRKVRVLDLNADRPNLNHGAPGQVIINPPLEADF
jgi:phosphoribosylglycinamide formyltransferase 1